MNIITRADTTVVTSSKKSYKNTHSVRCFFKCFSFFFFFLDFDRSKMSLCKKNNIYIYRKRGARPMAVSDQCIRFASGLVEKMFITLESYSDPIERIGEKLYPKTKYKLTAEQTVLGVYYNSKATQTDCFNTECEQTKLVHLPYIIKIF